MNKRKTRARKWFIIWIQVLHAYFFWKRSEWLFLCFPHCFLPAEDLVARFMTCDTGLTLGYILWPLSFPPPATRAEVTYSEWTGSVAWLGPSDYTEYNLSQAFRWWRVAQSQRAGRCSSLFSAHISSRRPHNLNSWNSFLRRRLVEDIWLALDCVSWPVTLVALFPALDNRGCTVSHANIGKFLLPIVVVLSLPRATNFSKHYKNFPTQSPTAETSRKGR